MGGALLSRILYCLGVVKIVDLILLLYVKFSIYSFNLSIYSIILPTTPLPLSMKCRDSGKTKNVEILIKVDTKQYPQEIPNSNRSRKYGQSIQLIYNKLERNMCLHIRREAHTHLHQTCKNSERKHGIRVKIHFKNTFFVTD